MALANVRPVSNVNTTIRAVAEFDATKPRILHHQKIGCVFADVTGAVSLEPIVVDSETVKVGRKQRAAIFIRPIITQVDHHARMSMPTTCLVGSPGPALEVGIVPRFVRIPVEVVSRLLDQLVGVWVKMFTKHSLVQRAGDHVPEVTNHGVDEKHLAMVIPVHAPRIGRTLCHDFKRFARRMISPDPTVDLGTFNMGHFRRTDMRRRRYPVSTVQPAVRAPA